MKSHIEKSKELYSKLAGNKTNKALIAGRYSFDEGKEQLIANDIISKLDLKKDITFFDIGCGGGIVTESLIKYLSELNAIITLMDISEVIDILNEDFISKSSLDVSHIQLMKGYFPSDYKIEHQRFDRILLYSVLHCTDNPFEVINEAVSLLNPYGKILLGDIPNINQKGRFLSSARGKIFEAEYKKTNVENIPVYKDHHDFADKMRADQNYYSLIDDELIYKIHRTYTQKGYDVFIIQQPEGLPFCKTRHDILICKHD